MMYCFFFPFISFNLIYIYYCDRLSVFAVCDFIILIVDILKILYSRMIIAGVHKLTCENK